MRPSHPADAFHVQAVVDGVARSLVARQADAQRLHGLLHLARDVAVLNRRAPPASVVDRVGNVQAADGRLDAQRGHVVAGGVSARLPVDAPIDAGVLVGPAVLEAVPLVVHGGLGGGECDGEGSVQVPLAQPAVIAAVPRGDDQLVRRLERREVQVERSLVVGLDVAHAVGAAAGRLFHEFRVEQTHLQGGDGRVRRKPVYRYKREVVVVFVDEALLVLGGKRRCFLVQVGRERDGGGEQEVQRCRSRRS